MKPYPYALVTVVAVTILVATIGCRIAPLQVVPQPRDVAVAPAEMPKIPPPDPTAAEVPPGYAVEVVATGLTYPSSIEFDNAGNMYVAEAGYAYGDESAPARVLRLKPSGETEVVAEQLGGPVTDLLWHQGHLYISHRGKISMLTNDSVVDIITGLPSLGDHHNNQLAAGPDGKLYLGQGTASNSGIIGIDNYAFGWLGKHPEFHDLTPFPIELTGKRFITINPLKLTSEKEALLVKTRAFQPFGEAGEDRMTGNIKASGTILRFNPDGSELEVFAWGLRNPFGVMWGPGQQLYVSDNGFDERGSRPIANAPDVIWRVKQGFWYGWPDFAGGIPVTDDQFKPDEGPRPEFLMKTHPSVEQPFVRFTPHVALTKIDFSHSPDFGYQGHMFVGQAGDAQPITGNDPRPVGYQVVRVDPMTGEIQSFFRTRAERLGSRYFEHVTTPGPKRIVDVRFSPEGDALYVADLGAMLIYPTPEPRPHPYPASGVIWRITREGAQPRFPAGFSFKLPAIPPPDIPTPTGRIETKAPEQAETIIRNWLPIAADVAKQLIAKYGLPQEATTNRLVWHFNRPWKRTEVVNEEVQHHFPRPHFDVLTQTVNYKVPTDKIDDLAQFDGSILVDRTKGELSVRGDGEAMNYLTMNLANEILIEEKNVREARRFFTESLRELKHSQYTTGLLFSPARLPQGDPGEPIPLP